MTTTTFTPAHVSATETGVEARQGRGLWRRILDRMVEAREAEAKRQVGLMLWTYSDETLKDFGLTRAELAQWHAGRQD